MFQGQTIEADKPGDDLLNVVAGSSVGSIQGGTIPEAEDCHAPSGKSHFMDVLQLSGLLAGGVKESRNDNPTGDF
jgi:hypothetical protein